MEMKRMRAQSTVVVPPQIGALLSQITETPDLETALRQVLAGYVASKREELAAATRRLERNWGMTYSEFWERMAAGALDQDSFSLEVESDFWEWERPKQCCITTPQFRFDSDCLPRAT